MKEVLLSHCTRNAQRIIDWMLPLTVLGTPSFDDCRWMSTGRCSELVYQAHAKWLADRRTTVKLSVAVHCWDLKFKLAIALPDVGEKLPTSS